MTPEVYFEQALAADIYFREEFKRFEAQLLPADDVQWTLTSLASTPFNHFAFDGQNMFFGTSSDDRCPLAHFAGRAWYIGAYLPQLWFRLLQRRQAEVGVAQARLKAVEADGYVQIQLSSILANPNPNPKP